VADIKSESPAGLRRNSQLTHQFQGGVLVSLGLEKHIEDFAFGVDGPPKVDHSAIDFQIDLVEMPSRVKPQATLTYSAAIIGPKRLTQRRTVS
jgi:hypothetical protein